MSFRESFLGAKDPLSHGFLRHKKGAGDLRRSEAADQTQRKRDASFHRKHRMERGKDKPQHVIVDHLIQSPVNSLSEPLLLTLKLRNNFFVFCTSICPRAQLSMDGASPRSSATERDFQGYLLPATAQELQ